METKKRAEYIHSVLQLEQLCEQLQKALRDLPTYSELGPTVEVNPVEKEGSIEILFHPDNIPNWHCIRLINQWAESNYFSEINMGVTFYPGIKKGQPENCVYFHLYCPLEMEAEKIWDILTTKENFMFTKELADNLISLRKHADLTAQIEFCEGLSRPAVFAHFKQHFNF